MSQFRPEAIAVLRRYREPAIGAALLASGLWIATRGGVFLAAIGAVLAALGAAWTVLALRRMRFDAGQDAPGLVEVDEARVTYMGPQMGGSISLPDLAEIRLLSLRGRRVWRLKQTDGQVLLVPLDASGAAQMFDTFAALPGLTSAALVAALDGDAPASTPATGPGLVGGAVTKDHLVWRRSGRGLASV